MNIAELGLLLTAVLMSGAGQTFLKLGALRLGELTADKVLSHILSIATIPELVIGLAAYGFGAIAYILLLTRVELSIAGPAASAIYIFSVLVGHFIFHEPIPLTRIIGLGFIICGVILVIAQKPFGAS